MSESDGRALCHPDFAMYMSGTEPLHRDDAAEILEYVGKNGVGGCYPNDIPPYLLGRAVRRLVFNYFTDSEAGEQDGEAITRYFLAGFFKLAIIA